MFKEELQQSKHAARIAGQIIMSYYDQDFKIETKDDNSPVTIADKEADRAIRMHLAAIFPNYSFLTEEGADDLKRLENSHVWIVDPLDGTKDFINHDDEFTVNIALSVNGVIKVGVVFVPVTNTIYYATENGGAFRQKGEESPVRIYANKKTRNLTISHSRYHQREEETNFIKRNSDIIKNIVTFGSTLKALKIAEGEIEMFYRSGRGTKEWDIAASDLIITEAGGLFINHDETKFIYNKKDVNNYNGYLIVNRKENIRK